MFSITMSKNSERKTLESLIDVLRNRLYFKPLNNEQTARLCNSILEYEEQYRRRFGNYYHSRQDTAYRKV